MASRRRASMMIEGPAKKRKLDVDVGLDEAPVAVVAGGQKFYIHRNLLRAASESFQEHLPPTLAPNSELIVDSTTSETFTTFSRWLYSGIISVAEMEEELRGQPEASVQVAVATPQDDGQNVVSEQVVQREQSVTYFRTAAATGARSEDTDGETYGVRPELEINMAFIKIEPDTDTERATRTTSDTIPIAKDFDADGNNLAQPAAPNEGADDDAVAGADLLDDLANTDADATAQTSTQHPSTAQITGPWWKNQPFSRRQRVLARIVDLYLFGDAYASVTFRTAVILLLQRFISNTNVCQIPTSLLQFAEQCLSLAYVGLITPTVPKCAC